MQASKKPLVTFKSECLNYLLDFIYEKFNKESEQTLNGIIQRFAAQDRKGQSAFQYHGNIYFDKARPISERPPTLTRELRPAMDAWLEIQEDMKLERQQISNYLCSILLLSHNPDTIQKLLPECLRAPFRQKLNKISPNTPTHSSFFSPEELESMLPPNQEPVQLIKQRLLMNILT